MDNTKQIEHIQKELHQCEDDLDTVINRSIGIGQEIERLRRDITRLERAVRMSINEYSDKEEK